MTVKLTTLMPTKLEELTVLASLSVMSEPKSLLRWELDKVFGSNNVNCDITIDSLMAYRYVSYNPVAGKYEITNSGREALEKGLESAKATIKLISNVASLKQL